MIYDIFLDHSQSDCRFYTAFQVPL